MTISRDDVLLADRFPEDERNHRAQAAKVKKIREDEWEALVRKHKERLAGEEGKLHKLSGLMKQSGDARKRLEDDVDADTRRAVEQAEIERRVAHGKIPEREGAVKNAMATLERLKKGGADPLAVKSQRVHLDGLEKELAEARAAVKKADGRVESARKAFSLAIEALRKDALEQE